MQTLLIHIPQGDITEAYPDVQHGEILFAYGAGFVVVGTDHATHYLNGSQDCYNNLPELLNEHN